MPDVYNNKDFEKKSGSPRALIAMSGGVDSSVAALCMQQRGYTCIGMTMKLYDNEDIGLQDAHTCCSLDDIEDARAVCNRLGMSHYVVNFKEDFSRQVIDRFVSAYEKGDTPNPCIDCNRYMKFKLLYEKAGILDCDLVVTGHYVRTEYDEKTGKWLLKKGKNRAKDQSYVLYFLSQEQLAHSFFPLGAYEDKEQIRELARDNGFINARKHDSQDICFVPDGDYASFIRRRTGREYPAGDFLDEEGKVLGRHRGLIHYTIGQRKGLGLALPAPLYVQKKDLEANTVRLVPNDRLFSKRLVAGDFHWVSGEAPATRVEVTAKPRYRAPEAPAVASVLPDGKVEVVFHEPQRAITSGQAVVLYDQDVVLGGGTIL